MNIDSLAGLVTSDQLPGCLREIAEEIGIEAALSIANKFGGQDIYLPSWPKTGRGAGECLNYIISLLGEDKTKRLCMFFGSVHLSVPNCKQLMTKIRDRHIYCLVQNGTKRRVIVREFGLTDRRIRQIAARMRNATAS